MLRVKRSADTPRFVPDYLAKSVTDINFEELKKLGVKFVAFDADSTLVPFRGKVLSDDLQNFLNKQRGFFKDWCIASNRPLNDLEPLGKSITAKIIRAKRLKRKPRRAFFERVIQYFNAEPPKIAMIGDKLIADIWGAKRAGFVTVWVERIGPDSPWDKLFQTRRWERRMMKRFNQTTKI